MSWLYILIKEEANTTNWSRRHLLFEWVLTFMSNLSAFLDLNVILTRKITTLLQYRNTCILTNLHIINKYFILMNKNIVLLNRIHRQLEETKINASFTNKIIQWCTSLHNCSATICSSGFPLFICHFLWLFFIPYNISSYLRSWIASMRIDNRLVICLIRLFLYFLYCIRIQ